MSGETYVYVIAGLKDGWPVGPVKVGVSNNVAGRLASLQTGSPIALTCLQAFPMPEREVALGVEKAFHEVMKRFRMTGEWFDMDPLDAVRAMTDNIEMMLYIAADLDDDEVQAALEITGVHYTRKQLEKAVAARDEVILRAMQ